MSVSNFYWKVTINMVVTTLDPRTALIRISLTQDFTSEMHELLSFLIIPYRMQEWNLSENNGQDHICLKES